jgi:hypothetical protein
MSLSTFSYSSDFFFSYASMPRQSYAIIQASNAISTDFSNGLLYGPRIRMRKGITPPTNSSVKQPEC